MRDLAVPAQFAPDLSADASRAAAENRLDFRAMLGVIRRRRWLVLATVVFVAGLAVLTTSQLRARYTATALVVVDSRDSQMLGFQPGLSDAMGANSSVDTEVEIARSAKVLHRTAAAIDITSLRDFAKRVTVGEYLKSLVGLADLPKERPYRKFDDTPSEEQARLIDLLGDQVNVRRVGLTSVIAMSATGYAPEFAAQLANAISDAYLTEQMSAKIGSNERAASFLRTRVDELARNIAALENQIDQFVSTKLVELGSPEARDLLRKLDEEAKTRSFNAQTLDRIQGAMQGRDGSRLAELLSAQEADLASRRSILSAVAADASDSARAEDARKALDALDSEIRASALKRSNGLQTDIALSEARSAQIRSQVSEALAKTQLPKEISVELFRLQRDAETSRSLYANYLTKLRQVEQQTDFTVPDSRVIASASPPNEASFPPRALIIGGSLFFSLGLGIGLAFLREHFVGGVTSTEQLENLVGLRCVAGVPVHRAGSVDRAVVTHPLSAFSEAIRRLRLGVETNTPGNKVSVLVTSTVPGDGKTTIALSLARQFALTGASTILIDADLRHPQVHKLLDEDPGGGLKGFLTSGSTGAVEDISVVKEADTGLSLVLGGTAGAGATDSLLMSRRFNDLMAFVKEAYDVVIVDTPPSGLLVDASIVARHCDLAVYVVRYASTSQQELLAGLQDLGRRTDLAVCTVLNRIVEFEGRRAAYEKKYRGYYR